MQKSVKGRRFIALEEVQAVVASLPYPRFYLDIGTIRCAAPIWPGTRPCEQIPFQWSCHIEDAPGRRPRHYEYLAAENVNPRRDFAECLALCVTTEEPGPIIVYDAASEKSILQETAGIVPEYAARLNAIRDSIGTDFDILHLVRNYYYHPAMNGGWSINNILATIMPDRENSELVVQDDDMAQAAFLEMLNGSARSEKLCTALLAYGKRKTADMVRLMRFFTGERAQSGRHGSTSI